MSDIVEAADPGTAPPTDPTIDQLLHASPLGPLLDTPIGQVLAGLGLPPIPQLPSLPPLPGLPDLPAIDVTGLLSPITDLLGGFGTGDLGSADPTAFLDGISQALDLSISAGSAALRALDGLWAGTGATANTVRSAQTATDSAGVGLQAAGIRANTTAAAAIVAAGLAAVQAVVIKTVGLIAAAAPALVTPPGQAFAIGAAADGLAEATAIVTATRAQLAAPTTGVAAVGAPVPVAGAPAGTVSPFAVAGALLEGIGKPLSGVGSRALAGGFERAAPERVRAATDAYGEVGCPSDVVGGFPASTAAAGLRTGGLSSGATSLGAASPQAPLSARTPGAALGTAAEPAAVGRAVARNPAASTGYVPFGAPGTMRGAGASEVRHHSADYLTTAPNGREIVGEIDDAQPAVLGDDAASSGVMTAYHFDDRDS